MKRAAIYAVIFSFPGKRASVPAFFMTDSEKIGTEEHARDN